MGPRHLSRGIDHGLDCQGLDRHASMGPRHLSRGIWDGQMWERKDDRQLQWGHGI